MLNRVKLQLALALFWFISAYLSMGAVLPWDWAWRCAWLNVIIGLLGLLLVTRTEEGDKIFYRGPEEGKSGLWQVGMLWAIPVIGLFVAVLWWLARLLGIFHW